MSKISAPWLLSSGSQAVCGMLMDAGYQAWFVGGCVRNALMERPVSDLDLTTDAVPQAVIELAQSAGLKCVPTGVEHGTVTVIADSVPYEITTFRRDIDTDGRRATVVFSQDIKEDAARRDFTMNALYASIDGSVSDPLGGLPDLRARRVRFIGDPDARIAEDYLRILRFFRFYAIYGDPSEGIDADGLAACAAGLDGLEHLSRERVGAEMRKLLGAADPAPAMAAMRSAGVLLRLLPGAGTGLLPVLVHVEEAAGLSSNWMVRLAALGGEDVAKSLRLSNSEAATLDRLSEGLSSTTSPAELGYRFGAQTALDILALRAAAFEREIATDDIAGARQGDGQIFPVTAADLMPEIQGPALGKRLAELEARWLASGFSLDRSALLSE